VKRREARAGQNTGMQAGSSPESGHEALKHASADGMTDRPVCKEPGPGARQPGRWRDGFRLPGNVRFLAGDAVVTPQTVRLMLIPGSFCYHLQQRPGTSGVPWLQWKIIRT